jgi:predicted GTPase
MPAGSEETNYHLAARAYGVLATALREALAEARRALAPHETYLPAGTHGALDELIAEFERKRVRIALFGEVKAGKSTMINAIAGAALSPMAFDPLTSVPVRITYGSSTLWRVGTHRLDSIVELENLMRAGAVGGSEVIVETNLDLLQLGGQVDLLDTPGVGSDSHFDAVTDEALRSLDAVVLVVRYPALFTQITRRLVERLDTDIGKLFVVWNLDATCAELSPTDRARHAESLKTNVAGAHELHLVDARAAFRGGTDTSARDASGMTAFVDAIARFASSTGREVAALREAAKQAQQCLTQAHQPLRERQARVEKALAESQTRLDAVQGAAQAESDSLRARQSELETALGKIGQEASNAALQRASALRSALTSARRRWVRRGELRGLEAAVSKAIRAYADEVANAVRGTRDAIVTQAAVHGAQPSLPMWVRTEPQVGRLTTEDRNVRASTGSVRMLRRALWRGWYLPGLKTLEVEGIDRELAAQAAWRDVALQTAASAARQGIDARLNEIAGRASTEAERIKKETGHAALEAEATSLREDLPAIEAQVDAVKAIASEARQLADRR